MVVCSLPKVYLSNLYAHFHSHCYIDQSFLAESSDLFLLKTFVHHTSYGCMVWFTNAKQANIRRETYTSQLMKGERCTIERPLFISSANFQLINICLHRIKKVRIHLHTLTSQQKIHWYRVEYITLFCNGFTDARATPKNSVNLIPWGQKWLL